MAKKVNVLVLRTAGTNCDQETVFAFEQVGAQVTLLHVHKLLGRAVSLHDYQILALPGGFTYGDDIAAGRILANELRVNLKEDLEKFIAEGKLIIGICNGFQVMVKSGILPGAHSKGHRDFSQKATLMINDSGKFEDRWVYLKPDGHCVWTKGIDRTVYFPVAHGEGKFAVSDKTLLTGLKEEGQVAFRYCAMSGEKPAYPENPNGSIDDIAGICDKSGRLFGLMPHPERHFLSNQHPYWTRIKTESRFGDGAQIFQNGVNCAKGLL